jgi:hypothetical protein
LIRPLLLLLAVGCDWSHLSSHWQIGVVSGGPYNYAFVTSTTVAPGMLGGASAADAECARRAQAAGLPGTRYLAWISTASQNAADRLRTTGARGWVRVDSRPFADSVDALTDRGQVYLPLRIDELGHDRQAVESSQVSAATGTTAQGTATGSTCGDWTTPTGRFTYGDAAASTFDWTQAFEADCSAAVHLYCFEVDQATPLAPAPVRGRIAFLSSAAFTPAGGIAAADALCQADARTYHLDGADQAGSYLALLSTAAASAASRMDLSGATWVRIDGVPWLARVEDLATGEILGTLNVTLDGQYHPYPYVYTGSAQPGDKPSGAAQSCADWTSSAVGDTAIAGAGDFSNRRAFDESMVGCDGSAALYCLQR